MRDTTRDVHAQLKALRLNGMAVAWADLVEQGGDSTLDASRWLVEHLLQAEDADRAMRSIAHQMKSARFPMHRDLAGFNFEVSQVDKALIQKLSDLSFTDDAQNAVLIGGPGTGKTHLATALGIEACHRGKKVRFYRVTELITQMMEAREERALTRIKGQLAKLDLLILDELGYVPASKLGAELLFDVISTAYERTSVIVTTNLPFERWVEVLGCERLTGATLERLTHRCHVPEANGQSYRLKDATRRRKRQ